MQMLGPERDDPQTPVESTMEAPTPFHRMFGLAWLDFFDGSDFEVNTEVDLSIKEQYLDVVVVRKGAGRLPRQLPDGFELAVHNLITFKSYQQALDREALTELIGHFVHYRKQASPSRQKLLPETDFRLFAVCARFPQQLARETALAQLAEGVYELRSWTQPIRIIVASALPKTAQNAMLHVFSDREELIRYGREHYRPYSKEASSLLYKLLQLYEEDPDMSEKLKEFVRQTIKEVAANMTLEERLEGLSAEERLKGLPAEDRLKGLPAEDRLKGLSIEEMLRALSPEEREALVRQLKISGS
jgi:hypothetical protein